MCISLPYEPGICEVTVSTEKQILKKRQGRLFMAQMLSELPTMLTINICEINK
jgi:hypothetical protein